MVEICLITIALLLASLAFLIRKNRLILRDNASLTSDLENRTTESTNYRISLDRRKKTHAQNLEDMNRHYERMVEEEKRKVHLDWTAKQDATIKKYREELSKQSQEIRSEYERQVESLREEFRQRNRLLLSCVEDLIEPTTTGDCIKVRCHTDEEGVLWARKFEKDRGLPAGSFKIYRCRRCLHNPIYGERYVHITTADPKLKMIMTDAPTFSLVHPREKLAARFSPADLANLRKKVQQEDS